MYKDFLVNNTPLIPDPMLSSGVGSARKWCGVTHFWIPWQRHHWKTSWQQPSTEVGGVQSKAQYLLYGWVWQVIISVKIYKISWTKLPKRCRGLHFQAKQTNKTKKESPCPLKTCSLLGCSLVTFKYQQVHLMKKLE